MNRLRDHRKLVLVLCTLLALTSACHKAERESYPDHPRLTSNVVLRDVTFHSASLNRNMPYRVVMPANIPTGVKFPVVYLLHGGSGDFRDWTNYSDVARFAEHGLILVMPDGDESYYTNSADHPDQRYEDYIVKDVVADAETRFPVASDRSHRAIAGISMGGFGAVKLSLKHPAVSEVSGSVFVRSRTQFRARRPQSSIFHPPLGTMAASPFNLRSPGRCHAAGE